MKYKWIELYGYAGIYNGMGLMQIKIDFSLCRTNKIIIRGSNGSGKSTLINAININPDSNDKFIPTEEARKNICLDDNGVLYLIRYIHPITNSGRGTTRGYISKMVDGAFKELNPNGNISSCKEIIYDEFGIDSNYASLASLSSENRGLVDSKPAERKKLINSIINILDVYNGIYKNLTKKASTYRQLINSITYKIDYLGNPTQLVAKMHNIETRLASLEDEKVKTIETIASVKLRIAEYNNILKENNYADIVSQLKDIGSHIKILRSQVNKKMSDIGITDIDKIDLFGDFLSNQVIILESNVESMKSRLSEIISQREVEFRELQEKQQKLDGLQSEHNYIDIKEAVTKARKIIDDYGETFATIGFFNVDAFTKSEYDSAMESIKYLKDLAGSLAANHHQEDLIYVFNNEDAVRKGISSLQKMNKMLDTLFERKSAMEAEIAVFISKMDIIDQLETRPKKCTIDDCPYIKTAIETAKKYPKSKLSKLQADLDKIILSISNYKLDIDRYSEYKLILDDINAIRRELSQKMRFISKLPVAKNFEEGFIERAINLDPFSDIDMLYEYVDYGNIIDSYNLAKRQLIQYEAEYKIYEAKNDIIESILDNIESLRQKTDKLADQITEYDNSITDTQNKIARLKQAKTTVEALSEKIKSDLEPAEQKQTELQKIKETLDINMTEITKLQEDLSGLHLNLDSIDKDIKILSSQLDEIKHSLILIDDYKAELEDYNNKYKKIEKIRYYSSPSTGIQTLFMQLYMNKILSTANNLLAMLFEGEFTLKPFIVNDSEFRIPCVGNGLMHDDISSMSTAQKCMISMILSFSILHQSSTRYNIISLDELDGGLDTSNRSFFIDLLDKLMLMLNCEQCFMISHNNELNTSCADIIILKNNSGDIYDGNVIWQY